MASRAGSGDGAGCHRATPDCEQIARTSQRGRLAQWTSSRPAPEQLLARLGEAMEFAVGVLWLGREDTPDAPDALVASVLVTRARRVRSSQQRATLQSASGQAPPRPSRPGTPGSLSVIVSLAEAPAVLGRDAATGAGLRGWSRSPAVSGDRTVAVWSSTRARTHPAQRHPGGSLRRHGTSSAISSPPHRRLRHASGRPASVKVLQLAAGHGTQGRSPALSLRPLHGQEHFENIYAKWSVSTASAVAKALREGVIQ